MRIFKVRIFRRHITDSEFKNIMKDPNHWIWRCDGLTEREMESRENCYSMNCWEEEVDENEINT